jgi:hypothetical protein
MERILLPAHRDIGTATSSSNKLVRTMLNNDNRVTLALAKTNPPVGLNIT